MTEPSCFICGGMDLDAATTAYRRCRTCGHETLATDHAQGYILNDPLMEADAKRMSGLDRFKRKLLLQFDPNPPRGAQLVDVGSASGKFLYQNRGRYAHAVGLEITPEALAFSREVLGLDVVDDISQVPANTHIATAWHSLEHIPGVALVGVLESLSAGMRPGARFIVSVPNAASRQYRWFGSGYAFFDVPNHLHQFSQESLDRLLARFGYQRMVTVPSWPYNSFGYTQGLLNVLTGTHNYLYYRLKRRSRKSSLWLDLAHAALLPILVPVGWTLGLLDAVSLNTQGVITACYKKKIC